MSLHQSSHRQDSFDIVILIFILVFLGLCWYRFKKRKVYHDPLIKKIKYDVSQLDPRIETIEFYSSDESYTEDKKKIYICLRDESGEYYDYNMLMYVAIHECSHALTHVIDPEHVTKEFRGMFQNLLRKATQMKMYNPTTPLVKHYCGINLDIKDMQR